MIQPIKLKPEFHRKKTSYIDIGSRGSGKTEQMISYFRWYNCKKYRFAIEGIDWKDRRHL